MMNHKVSLIFCILLIASCIFSTNRTNDWKSSKHIDWRSVNLDDTVFWQTLQFPKHFSWGVATSAYQIEGTKTHNGFVQNSFTYQNPEKYYDVACDHWDRYQEDIALLKELGVDEYRFSIAWEKIEPQQGVFDQHALNHYIDLCKKLRENNIEPVVCLFHFVLPVWFYEKNGFEEEQNCRYFVRFAHYIFKHLNPYVSRWITYNEPIAYVIESYHMGNNPPYQRGISGLYTAGTVLKNMLNTHVTLYHLFKAEKPNVHVGLVKMFHLLDPHKNRALEKFFVSMADHLVYDALFTFFKTGYFSWLKVINGYNKQAVGSLDFIGVNYYTREFVKQVGLFGQEHGAFVQHETTTDMGWAIYPEGLYRALVKAQELGVPIYISENGIADAQDTLRNEFIKKHIYIVQRAIQNGIDVRGYSYWSFMDTYEWCHDYSKKFGLYAVDFEHDKKRTLRDGAKPFINYLKQRKMEDFA